MRRGAETLFLGSYVNKIDAKGRLATPARFRRVLELEKSNEIYCYPSPDEPCLDCGGPDFIETLMASIGGLAPFSRERRVLQRSITAKTFIVSMDKEGRIILPQHLRDHAGLDGEAEFSGNGEFFQIWAPETLQRVMDEAGAEAAAAREKLQNPGSLNGGAE